MKIYSKLEQLVEKRLTGLKVVQMWKICAPDADGDKILDYVGVITDPLVAKVFRGAHTCAGNIYCVEDVWVLTQDAWCFIPNCEEQFEFCSDGIEALEQRKKTILKYTTGFEKKWASLLLVRPVS